MNRLQYLICAKTQYNIQSPFLFDLYQNVIAPKLGRATLEAEGIARNDRFSQLQFKLCDHYRLTPAPSITDSPCDMFLKPDGSTVGLFRYPHRDKASEALWSGIIARPGVTLTVDLFYAGLFFSSPKLSRQHFLLR